MSRHHTVSLANGEKLSGYEVIDPKRRWQGKKIDTKHAAKGARESFLELSKEEQESLEEAYHD